MTLAKVPSPPEARSLRRALMLTRLGLVTERASRAFWPVWSLLFAALAAVMMGAQDTVVAGWLWFAEALWAGAMVVAFGLALRRFQWPTRMQARARLDQTLPGRPLAALEDSQAIGAHDAASRAVWLAYQARMAAGLKQVRVAAPDLKLARFDPFGFRLMALLAFAVALLFGSYGRLATMADLVPGQSGAQLASGLDWEGWVEPPAYTRKPNLYLNDLIGAPLKVPVGSRILLRFYGESGAGRLRETVSVKMPVPDETQNTLSFVVAHDGTLKISGVGAAKWQVTALPDQPPTVRLNGVMTQQARGKMSQPFAARDDYDVVGGQAEFTLDMERITRIYGLATPPDPRKPLLLDLPMPINGNRADFSEQLIDDLSSHPWSNLPVRMTLRVRDARNQTGNSVPARIILPGRRFFDPLAAAVIEQRRDLLWARANGERVAQVLRALISRPAGFVRNQSGYLMLRAAIVQLEAGVTSGLDASVQTEVAAALWQVALLFEDGALSDARQRMQRAQDRLSEAMKNGASDAEISDLMQELRDATKDFMRQLAEQQGNKSNSQNAKNQQTQEITQEQIQAMMDKIQALMKQGRMAEAQRLMKEFNQMMQNLQVTKNQQGGSGKNSGAQAMDGLKKTLRQQQGLSDQAFRDLQEQFNPQNGASKNHQNQGQNGELGRGQGQQGQGREGQGREGRGRSGQNGGQPGQQTDPAENGATIGNGTAKALAQRQQALQQQLRRQQSNLPAAGSPDGDAARQSLGQAGEAMGRAQQALRNNDLAQALGDQAETMQALRDGLRSLDLALGQQAKQRQTGAGQGQATRQGTRDPLGRDAGGRGRVGNDGNLLRGQDVYRRARELLDEIRRRTGEQNRSKMERDYLKRLLEKY